MDTNDRLALILEVCNALVEMDHGNCHDFVPIPSIKISNDDGETFQSIITFKAQEKETEACIFNWSSINCPNLNSCFESNLYTLELELERKIKQFNDLLVKVKTSHPYGKED